MDTLPDCAKLRQCGTVIVKPKDDCYRICSTGRTNFVSTPNKCELCVRTRTNSQYSDCDSEKVKKCRPHRSSTTRSRYVNVCAAVCLLLLVGDLSPQSSAAPRPRKDKMGNENVLWANPCSYSLDSATSAPKVFKKSHAQKVANQARIALGYAVGENGEFKQKFASSIYFDEKSTTPWLRNMRYVTPAVFPENKKTVGNEMEVPPEDLSQITSNNFNGELKYMYYALKMVAAGLYAIKEHGLDLNVQDEKNLQDYFNHYFDKVRSVLCEFSEGIPEEDNIPLTDDEIPTIHPSTRPDTMFMIYRDSMLYLDYLRQIMEYYVETA